MIEVGLKSGYKTRVACETKTFKALVHRAIVSSVPFLVLDDSVFNLNEIEYAVDLPKHPPSPPGYSKKNKTDGSQLDLFQWANLRQPRPAPTF